MGDANSISECFAYLLIFFCTQVLQSCVSFRYFGIVASNQYVWVTCSVLQIWRCGLIIKVCNRLNSNKLCTSKIKSSTKGAIVITVSTYLIFIYLLIHYIIWYTCDSCNSTTLYGNFRFRMLSPFFEKELFPFVNDFVNSYFIWFARVKFLILNEYL